MVVLHLGCPVSNTYVKYPRTPHLPWSPGSTPDDERLDRLSNFVGREIVVTEKLDGENTSLYSDHVHARSLDSGHHPSRSWVKALQGRVGPLLPSGWRLCGENCFATHSIAYDNLDSYFILFSVWNESNQCLDWEQTVEWAALLEVALAPVLYRGPWNERLLRRLPEQLDLSRQEGFVVRTAAGFAYSDFGQHMAKWVRSHHVTTDAHWMTRAVVANRLRGEPC